MSAHIDDLPQAPPAALLCSLTIYHFTSTFVYPLVRTQPCAYLTDLTTRLYGGTTREAKAFTLMMEAAIDECRTADASPPVLATSQRPKLLHDVWEPDVWAFHSGVFINPERPEKASIEDILKVIQAEGARGMNPDHGCGGEPEFIACFRADEDPAAPSLAALYTHAQAVQEGLRLIVAPSTVKVKETLKRERDEAAV